jgi:polysaccharide transporter, PST family
MSAFSLIFCLGGWLFEDFIARLFFGGSSLGVAPMICWIAPLPILIAISSVLGIQTMLAFGLDRQFSRILLSSGILNVAVAILLIHPYGAQGAGATVLLTESVVAVSMFAVLWRNGIRIPILRSLSAGGL